MFVNRIITWLAAMRPAVVQAHCDTAEGPAVTDGRKALETANVNYALKWVPADGEADVREVFNKALRIRGLGPDAAEVADRLFLETLVRVHRMAEGVGFFKYAEGEEHDHQEPAGHGSTGHSHAH